MSRRFNKPSKRVRVECQIIRETERAILLRQGAIEEWIPRSVCHHISKRPSAGDQENAVITMDAWLADDRGLDSEEE